MVLRCQTTQVSLPIRTAYSSSYALLLPANSTPQFLSNSLFKYGNFQFLLKSPFPLVLTWPLSKNVQRYFYLGTRSLSRGLKSGLRRSTAKNTRPLDPIYFLKQLTEMLFKYSTSTRSTLGMSWKQLLLLYNKIYFSKLLATVLL